MRLSHCDLSFVLLPWPTWLTERIACHWHKDTTFEYHHKKKPRLTNREFRWIEHLPSFAMFRRFRKCDKRSRRTLSLANWCPPRFASQCMSQTSELVSRFHETPIETHRTVYRTVGPQNQQFVCSHSKFGRSFEPTVTFFGWLRQSTTLVRSQVLGVVFQVLERHWTGKQDSNISMKHRVPTSCIRVLVWSLSFNPSVQELQEVGFAKSFGAHAEVGNADGAKCCFCAPLSALSNSQVAPLFAMTRPLSTDWVVSFFLS